MTSSFRVASSMADATTCETNSSLISQLRSLHGLFAIYKKQGQTSAQALGRLKKKLLTGKRVFFGALMWSTSVTVMWSKVADLMLLLLEWIWSHTLAVLLFNWFVFAQRLELQIQTLVKGKNNWELVMVALWTAIHLVYLVNAFIQCKTFKH